MRNVVILGRKLILKGLCFLIFTTELGFIPLREANRCFFQQRTIYQQIPFRDEGKSWNKVGVSSTMSQRQFLKIPLKLNPSYVQRKNLSQLKMYWCNCSLFSQLYWRWPNCSWNSPSCVYKDSARSSQGCCHFVQMNDLACMQKY